MEDKDRCAHMLVKPGCCSRKATRMILVLSGSKGNESLLRCLAKRSLVDALLFAGAKSVVDRRSQSRGVDPETPFVQPKHSPEQQFHLPSSQKQRV